MADALLSPGVGGVMLAATAAIAIYCASKIKSQLDNRKIPLKLFIISINWRL